MPKFFIQNKNFRKSKGLKFCANNSMKVKIPLPDLKRKKPWWLFKILVTGVYVFPKNLFRSIKNFKALFTTMKTDSIWSVHSLSFIRNAYKEQFSWVVKFFEKIRNRLVIFQKIKEQTSSNISEKQGFSSKKIIFLGYILIFRVRNDTK